MIVLNKDVASPAENPTVKHAHIEMFKRELDAYCDYKKWSEETDDFILEMALDEIMKDEYLHAKFLRDYLIRHDIYHPDEHEEYEKKFMKIHKNMVR